MIRENELDLRPSDKESSYNTVSDNEQFNVLIDTITIQTQYTINMITLYLTPIKLCYIIAILSSLHPSAIIAMHSQHPNTRA